MTIALKTLSTCAPAQHQSTTCTEFLITSAILDVGYSRHDSLDPSEDDAVRLKAINGRARYSSAGYTL